MCQELPDKIRDLSPSFKGSYVLEFQLESPLTLRIGALGSFSLEPGSYYYVGSALNGLKARLRRHILGIGKTHWHIDYLTKVIRPSRVWFTISSVRQENQIADTLAASLGIALPGFGCSDSRTAKTHLFKSTTSVNMIIALANIDPRAEVVSLRPTLRTLPSTHTSKDGKISNHEQT
jgi:Uri superfamily endonuclease